MQFGKLKQLTVTFIISFLLGVNAISVYAACPVGLDNAIQSIIDIGLPKYPKMLGIQLSILCNGESIPRNYVAGKRQKLAAGTDPLTANHLFLMGSITKSFTSTLLLKLEADGLLSIEDPIGKWLKYEGDDKEIPITWKDITIKQLLNQTSGISDYAYNGNFQDEAKRHFGLKQWEPKELVQFVFDIPLPFSPGHGYRYTSTNYVLAGMIADKVFSTRGTTFKEAMKTNIFEPLNLGNTFYLPQSYPSNIIERAAHGYLDDIVDVVYLNMSGVGAGGANVSNAQDVVLWFHQLMHGKVLPSAQMKEMMTMVDMTTGAPVNEQGYGLGIYQDDPFNPRVNETIWMHRGVGLAYHNVMYWLPCRDITIAYTGNFMNSSSDNGAILDNSPEEMIRQVIEFIQKEAPRPECQMVPAQPNNKGSFVF